MFHFPAFPPPALCVQAGVMGNYALSGFPIRKSPDQCLVADFPGLIAGSNVLLRLLVPRHPPCALINLATTDDARVHCAVLKIRAVPAPHRSRAMKGRSDRGNQPGGRSLRTQQRARPVRRPESAFLATCVAVLADPALTLGPNNQCSTTELATRVLCLRHSARDVALDACGRSPRAPVAP